MSDIRLDQRGALCPAPIIELGKAAKQLGAGRIVLLADDPAARSDVAAWCRLRKAQLVSQREIGDESGTVEYVVEVGSQPS